MNVRSATPLDVSALVSLNRYVQELHAAAVPSLFRSRPPEAEAIGIFHHLIEDPIAMWLVAEEGTPCGYLYAQFHDRPGSWFRPAHRICNINHLVVHPDARRKGVARQLVVAIAEEAERRGVARIGLDVWSFNREAREAFLRLGFKVFNERMELRSR